MYDDRYDVTKTEEFVSLHPCAQLGAKQVGNHADSCFHFNYVKFQVNNKTQSRTQYSQIPLIQTLRGP